MFGKRFSRALAVTTVASLVMAVAVFADVLDNNVTVGGNDTIVAGGSTTITYTLEVQGAGGPTGDGQGGCNASDGTPLAVTINVPSGAIATPSTLSFDSCGGAPTATRTVVFTSSTPGDYSITHTLTDANVSGGTYTNSANFTLKVSAAPPANTAPTVAVTGVAEGAVYEFGSVPIAQCSVTDAEDGPSTFAATLGAITGPLSAYDLGSQTATCDYTDEGGLSATQASATYSIVDTGKPVITDLGPVDVPDGLSGWYVSAVTNTFQASDSGAGFAAPLDNPHSFTKDSGTDEGSAVTINSGVVTDVASNEADAIDSSEFKIDLSDPTDVAFVGGPAAGSSYYFGSVPAAPTCTATDAVSGLAGCVVTGYSAAVGEHTMTATATDNAGRTAEATRTYTVSAWMATGFYRPVDMGTSINTVKGGSTVPLKFNVYAATELTDVSAVKGFKATAIACEAVAWMAADAIEITSTGNTTLRYDGTEGQFIQNWKTPNTKNVCYSTVVTFQDGTSIYAYFKTK